jgi:hypothetical protein
MYYCAINLATAEQCEHKHKSQDAAAKCARGKTRQTRQAWTAAQILPPAPQTVR